MTWKVQESCTKHFPALEWYTGILIKAILFYIVTWGNKSPSEHTENMRGDLF